MITNLRELSKFRPVRFLLGGLLCLLLGGGNAGCVQTAETLSQVKKVYVGSLGDGRGAAAMRERISDRLRATHKFQIVASPLDADAIIKGTGRIWATGYISLSVHASSANRHPIFDGFLSAELDGKAGTTLWSYLVTPSKFSVRSITTDLADQFVKKLLEAVEQESQETQTVHENPGTVTLHGAGATFPWPIYQKWFESFEQKSPDVRIHYEPVGSESGIRLLTERSIDFAGSDMPLSDQAMAKTKVKFLQFASVLGGVVPIYNLREVNGSLNFTPSALAGIYLGTIKRWNDAIIQAANPGIALPDSEIIVVHRSDGSGTTFVWSDYLSKVSPEWKEHVGQAETTISWPVGLGAERNEGVAALVREIPNSIGYVELIYAIQHELRYGAVRNAAGNFVKADVGSVTAAAAGVTDMAKPDFRISITNAPEKNAYPIATFTWLLVSAEDQQSAKKSAIFEFLRGALTSGQKQCSSLGYAPLPPAVANQELEVLKSWK